MRLQARILSFLVLPTILLCMMACGDASDVQQGEIDSLNVMAHKAMYRSLDDASDYVNQVIDKYNTSTYSDGFHEALLNKGDVYGMRMEYDCATSRCWMSRTTTCCVAWLMWI